MNGREQVHVHVLPLRLYLGVFLALLGLTALTTWVSYFDLGALNTVVAITIAGIKLLLVVLFFMHLRYSERLIWIIAAASLVWLLILFALTLSDYLTRVLVSGWA